MTSWRWLIIPALLIAQSADAASRRIDLEAWLTGDLIPYVEQQLRTRPRFRSESFRFVVIADDSPQSEGNALVLSIRDQLRDAMIDVPGIRIAWQGDPPGVGLATGSTPLDCTKNEANYLVGVELRETGDGEIDIQVRALDVEERAWVPDFSREWKGPVTREQYYNLRRVVDDPGFRGERHAPWSAAESDLMAAHLAYELGCKLLGQTNAEYVVALHNVAGDVDRTTALVELVHNNLAGIPTLQFAAGDANAIIEGKAHRIDDDLFQFWVTITPTSGDPAMTPLSADAYVKLDGEFQAADLVPEKTIGMSRSGGTFLADFSIVRLGSSRACFSDRQVVSGTTSARRQAGDCFALEVQTQSNAVVFFLNHQLNAGLVRLSDAACSQRSLARIGRAGQEVRLPLPLDTLQSGNWNASTNWSINPRDDVYYVIAATETKAARALSRHIESLPQRCANSVRPGLEGNALKQWLQELVAIQQHWSSDVAWQSLRVKDVY